MVARITYKAKASLKMIPTLTEVDTTAIDLVAEAHDVCNVTSILSHDGIEKVLNPMYNPSMIFLWVLPDRPLICYETQAKTSSYYSWGDRILVYHTCG